MVEGYGFDTKFQPALFFVTLLAISSNSGVPVTEIVVIPELV